ncbi:MAG: FAD-dependent oxidoreductase, partial [Actinomycetota bacterium]|nr:FAD-dependent oxidoreductase [Actinomycetota bacterium]
VHLTSYPEAARVLDHAALDLRAFQPGALVWHGGRAHRVGDPFRRPVDLVPTLRAPIGSLADKVRIAMLRKRVRSRTPAQLLRGPDGTTSDALREAGFSEAIIDRFFQPFLAGVLLDPDLTTSRRLFDVYWRSFADGEAVLPSAGMGAIPAQLAGALPEGTVRLGSTVVEVGPGGVVLADGTALRGDAVVVATEGPAAARLLGIPDPGSRPVCCVWFAADEPPWEEPVLLLDGEARGPASNVVVHTNVAPSYAPPGAALVACAVVGPGAAGLADAVRDQLRRWFGSVVDSWRHLRTDAVPHAQPLQLPPFSPLRAVRHEPGTYVCGDHRDTASIQGALHSGRRAAEAVDADLRR